MPDDRLRTKHGNFRGKMFSWEKQLQRLCEEILICNGQGRPEAPRRLPVLDPN